MKNNIIILISIFFLFAINIKPIYAQTDPTPSDSGLQEIKQQLITNIASKVAELKLVEKRGIIGNVTDVSNTQITLTDQNGNIRFVDVDELTKFSSPSEKGSYGISDINKGTTLGILGLYNKESRRILSRFVDAMTLPQFIYGVVDSINSQNYTITVKTEDKKYNTDIENTTKTFSYSSSDSLLSKAGFSKINVGQNIIVVGYTDNKDSSLIDAEKLIVFPDISTDPEIMVAIPSLNDSQKVIPSTGSGRKLTPIVK